MEESNDFARAWIGSRYVRALVPVAVQAGKGKVVEDCRPSMLARDDVIHVKGHG